MGMPQRLKIHSKKSLSKHEHRLRGMKVENMDATRPEDKAEILAGIPDKDVFDQDIQRLIFEELIPAWKSFDDLEQLSHVARIARWFKEGSRLGVDANMFRTSQI